MDVKSKKIEVEKKINEAMVNFHNETGLEIEEVNFTTEPKVGYSETKDYRVKIKAVIK